MGAQRRALAVAVAAFGTLRHSGKPATALLIILAAYSNNIPHSHCHWLPQHTALHTVALPTGTKSSHSFCRQRETSFRIFTPIWLPIWSKSSAFDATSLGGGGGTKYEILRFDGFDQRKCRYIARDWGDHRNSSAALATYSAKRDTNLNACKEREGQIFGMLQ